jgi:hypothetical protein
MLAVLAAARGRAEAPISDALACVCVAIETTREKAFL